MDFIFQLDGSMFLGRFDCFTILVIMEFFSFLLALVQIAVGLFIVGAFVGAICTSWWDFVLLVLVLVGAVLAVVLVLGAIFMFSSWLNKK